MKIRFCGEDIAADDVARDTVDEWRRWCADHGYDLPLGNALHILRALISESVILAAEGAAEIAQPAA